MKKIILSAFVLSLIYAFGSASETKAQTPPPGSYQQTCQKTGFVMGANMIAQCRRKNGSWKESEMLKAFWQCKGDISNQDGNLACAKDSNQPCAENLRKVTLASYAEVFGENLDEGKLYVFMNDVFQCKYCSELYFTDKLTQLQTTNYFRDLLMRNDYGAIRSTVADHAIKTVYGRGSYPQERALHEADMKIKTSYYAAVVEKETKKLNADKIVRGLMILQAYKDAMGRPPRKEDREYWLLRAENYSQLIEASRQWLYSPNGLKDLQETVKKYYFDTHGKQPDEQIVKTWIGQFAKGRKIYNEMNL